MRVSFFAALEDPRRLCGAVGRLLRTRSLRCALVLLLSIEPQSAQAQADCGCLDLALVIDKTGSMSGAVANLQAGLANIIATAQTVSGSDLRLGLVTFRDTVDVDSDWTTDVSLIQSLVGSIGASGGGGAAEASDEALNAVVNALPDNPPFQLGSFGPFRELCTKIALLVTDAPPGGFDDVFDATDDANALARAQEAAAQGIRIAAIQIGGAANTEPIMRRYATETGGIYDQLPSDGAGLEAAVIEMLEQCGGDCEPCPVCCDGAIPQPLLPNVFTPNGDGINDLWFVPGITNADYYRVEIFNRWGTGGTQFLSAEEFASDSGLPCFVGKATAAWDGTTSSGSPAPDGTYVFILTLENCEEAQARTFTGTILLLR